MSGGTDLCPPRVLRGAKCQAVGIDWIRATLPAGSWSGAAGLLERWWGGTESCAGRFFREAGLKAGEGASLHFNPGSEGEEAEGFCVIEIAGSALGLLTPEERVQVLNEVLSLGGRCTRLDVACDLKCAEPGVIGGLVWACSEGYLVGARRFRPIVDMQSVGGGSNMCCLGEGLYIGVRGSNGSGRFVRVYDKGLETQSLPRGAWVRWEVEFSDDCARQVAERICGVGEDLSWFPPGELAVMMTSPEERMLSLAFGAVDFRAEPGKRADRRKRCEWWAAFLGGIAGVRVRARRSKSTLESWSRWVARCVAPAVLTFAAAVGVCEGAFLRWIAGERLRETPEKLCTDLGRQLLAAWDDPGGFGSAVDWEGVFSC